MGASALRVTGASRTFGAGGGDRPVFQDVSLDLEVGETVALLGPSGCGKSTLLRVMAGLDPLTSGVVDVQLRDAAGRPAVGLVFQDPLLLPWLTVADNIRLGLRYRAHRAAARAARIDELLAEFGLTELADRLPDQLSGGQAQRVSLARTVVTGPRILLLDEPFAALDPRTRAGLHDWLRDLTRRHQLTVVLVTHDLDEALALGQRVLLLSARPGRIVAQWDVAAESSAPRGDLRRDILDRYESDLSGRLAGVEHLAA